MIERLALLSVLLALVWGGSRVIYWAGFSPLLRALGPHSPVGRGVFHLLMAPGTIVHETSHWLACKLLLVHVREFAPYRPQRDGTLGWVLHDRTDPLRGLAVALAPLVGGAIVLVVAARALGSPIASLPAPHDAEQYVFLLLTALPEAIGQASWIDWRTWLLLYTGAAVGRGIAPSLSDVRPVAGALAGLAVALAAAILLRDALIALVPIGVQNVDAEPVIQATSDQITAGLALAASALLLGGGVAVATGLLVQAATSTVLSQLAMGTRAGRRRR